MTEFSDRNFTHLPAAASRLGAVFGRPKTLAIGCVIALAALGWGYLAVLTAADYNGVVEVLCQPLSSGVPSTGGIALIAAMWAAMTLAMMIPSAAPMIYTYAEIADTAARKGERIVSPFVLAGGYTVVWLGFSIVATAAQLLFTRYALLDSGMASASGLFSGAILLVAGVYQFSALKHACLTLCRNPFPFFFTNWATTAPGVFRLGVKQGVYCFGCCWAMMAVMFAVGVMNVFWMAALGILMTVEKTTTGRRLTQAIGVALIAAGIAFVVVAFAAHWPPRGI
ncbi:MAG: DUF2182 domain-containing protein [Pseudolabrys sp.]